MKTMTQLEHLQYIIHLKTKFPDLEIHFCIDSEELTDHQWTSQKISKVELHKWFENGEEIIIDEDAIKDELSYIHYDKFTDQDVAFDKLIDEEFDKIPIAICVFTNP